MSNYGRTLALSSVLLTVSLLSYVVALERLRRFERARRAVTPWWFGYARDGVNLGIGAMLFPVFMLAGFLGPVALLLGVWLGFSCYLFDTTFGWWLGLRWARVLSTSLAVLAGLGALLCREPLSSSLTALLFGVAPRSLG